MSTLAKVLAFAPLVMVAACRGPEEPKTPPNSPIPELDSREEGKSVSPDAGLGGSATPDALKEPKK